MLFAAARSSKTPDRAQQLALLFADLDHLVGALPMMSGCTLKRMGLSL